MSFLKNVSRGFRSVVKRVDNGLHTLAGGIETGVKRVSDVKGLYGHLKNRIIEAAPGSRLAFAHLEASPFGAAARMAGAVAEEALASVGSEIKLAQAYSQTGKDIANAAKQAFQDSNFSRNSRKTPLTTKPPSQLDDSAIQKFIYE